MRFLREEGITNDLATRRLKAPRGGKPLPKSLTIDEIEALLNQVSDAIESPTELRDRAVIELLYAGGLRISEITALNVDHVNFDNSTVRIFGKGSKERIVPIYDAAMEAIAEYLTIGDAIEANSQDPDALFLNARGKRITRQGLWLQTQENRPRRWRSPKILRRTCCDTASHPTCSTAALRCATSKNSWATKTSRLRRSIPTSPRNTCVANTTPPIPERDESVDARA